MDRGKLKVKQNSGGVFTVGERQAVVENVGGNGLLKWLRHSVCNVVVSNFLKSQLCQPQNYINFED